jgi:hypothetical protein
MRFIFLSLVFVAPALALLLLVGLSWQEVRKERRRRMALREWLRTQS